MLARALGKWTAYYKAYRALFVRGSLLHIRRPDSRDWEATAWLAPDQPGLLRTGEQHHDAEHEQAPPGAKATAPPSNGTAMPGTTTLRGVLTLFNPTNKSVGSARVALSMYYAGLKPGQRVRLARLPVSSNMTWRGMARDIATAHSNSNGNSMPAGRAGSLHTVGGEGGGIYDIVVTLGLAPLSYVLLELRSAQD